jgi:hypothetical protein
MVTNQKRMALQRNARSADQVEYDRATNRKRMADWRKARSVDQVEVDRATGKKRMAVQREARTAYQVAVGRASDRKRAPVQPEARAANQVDNNGKDEAEIGRSYSYNHYDPSEYELRCSENIARNEARLRELGLGGKGRSMTSKSNFNKNKSRSAKQKVAQWTAPPPIPTRRSTRPTRGQRNIMAVLLEAGSDHQVEADKVVADGGTDRKKKAVQPEAGSAN